MPLSSNCTTWALSAVDIRSTPSTLPELAVADPVPAVAVRRRAATGGRRCRCRRTAPPGRCSQWTSGRRRAPCRSCGSGSGTGAPPAATTGRPAADAVGNDVMRSRAAPIGISVTVSTGARLRAGLSCSGVTTCWSSALQSAIFWARGGDPDRGGGRGERVGRQRAAGGGEGQRRAGWPGRSSRRGRRAPRTPGTASVPPMRYVALADRQRERQRAVVDRHGVVVRRPGAHGAVRCGRRSVDRSPSAQVRSTLANAGPAAAAHRRARSP